jgi:hypothetical protein
MSFDLTRLGWPNTVAVLALALVPFLALTVPAVQPPLVLQVEQAEPVAQTAMLQAPAISAE